MDYSNKAEVEDFAKRFADAVKLWGVKEKVAPELDPQKLESHMASMHRQWIKRAVDAASAAYGDELQAAAANRSKRTLEVELAGVWQLALSSYANFFPCYLPEKFQELLAEVPEQRVTLGRSAVESLKAHALPLLAEIENPGDSIIWAVFGLIRNAPSSDVVDAIAHRRLTPANSFELYYGLFGLLLQADAYLEDGKREAAYSCLLDAQQALGIAAGSRSITRHFAESARKRLGVVGGVARADENSIFTIRQTDLYYELRVGPGGTVRPWDSAEAAAYAVEDAMLRETELKELPAKGPLSADSIFRVCKRLFKLDAQGKTLNIQGIASVDGSGPP